MGGFTLVLMVLGAMREILGQGVIFSDMQLLFGPAAASWKIELVKDYPDFLFAILPPGAFMAMGILIALKNVIDDQLKQRAEAQKAPVESGTKITYNFHHTQVITI